MKYIMIGMLGCGLFLIQPQGAEANWFSNTWHKASHAAKKATHTVTKGASHAWKGTKKGLKKGSQWANHTYNQAKSQAEKAANEAQHLAKQGWDAVKNFAEHPTGNCVSLQRKARGEIMSLVAPKINSAMNQIPPTYAGAAFTLATCRSDSQIGFSCGPFAYASDIASSLKAGYRGVKSYTTAVGSAYRHECRNVPLELRASCAMDVAVAKEAGKSFQCVADIIKQVGKGSRKAFNEQQVCTQIGEMSFGMAADAMIANEAGAARKAVQIAQKIRTALNAPRSAGLPKSCQF